MKPPKNFYSNLDRRKQGLPEVPEASAADAGKVIKVGEDGDYELGEDAGSVLPDITDSDNYKLIQVRNSNYSLTYDAMLARSFVTTDSARNITSSQYITLRAVEGSTGAISFTFLASSMTINAIATTVNNGGAILHFTNKEGIKFIGFAYANSSTSITAIVHRVPDGQLFTLELESSTYTLTPIGSVKYYEIEASGSSVSLPSGVTFADVYAELMAGVDVKFTDGARVYSVTSFESTNIRAHWMTDLDLTSMEIYVINLASDGTGTVASATFSGS